MVNRDSFTWRKELILTTINAFPHVKTITSDSQKMPKHNPIFRVKTLSIA